MNLLQLFVPSCRKFLLYLWKWRHCKSSCTCDSGMCALLPI